MTTPDDQITGYGGLPKHDGTSPVSQPSGSTSGMSQASGSGTEDAKAKAREVAEEVKKQGKDHLEGYRETAADELEKVAKSAKAAAAELDQSHSGLSRYVSDMAQSMVSLADDLRGKSVDELVGEVNRIARNNPGLFITGSIAIGFGLTRFARASSRRAATGDYSHSSLTSGMRHDSHSYSQASDQRELNERISSGQPGGTIGSVSNAGVSSATSAGMGASGSSTTGSTGGNSLGSGPGGSSTGASSGAGTGGGTTGMPHSTTGSGLGSGSSGSATSGLGAGAPSTGAGPTGSHPNSGPGVTPTTDRTGKNTDGGMF